MYQKLKPTALYSSFVHIFLFEDEKLHSRVSFNSFPVSSKSLVGVVFNFVACVKSTEIVWYVFACIKFKFSGIFSFTYLPVTFFPIEIYVIMQ